MWGCRKTTSIYDALRMSGHERPKGEVRALGVKGFSGSGASLAAMLKNTRPKPRYAVER
jgi:hypothetical protein